MRHRVFNEAGSDDLVFLMGFGNRYTHENASWFIGTLANAGYRVHAFEFPVDVTDFRADWVEPVAEYVRDLDDYQLLAHSAGCLIGQALDGADNHVYLAPFWGYGPLWNETVLELVGAIPTDFPFLPVRGLDRDALGVQATDHQLATMARWVSPAFVRETLAAQESILEIDHDAVAFCSLTDPVIDLAVVGENVPAEHVVLYDGGHELFSSPERDQYVETVISALEDGAAAIEREPLVAD
ncbi:alpha/beta fold hydrolase [Halovivax gelatinilyticus]|uniref:alpha/beta fold hydrolase n=1 Tax=Halovivax gelatinilyticus TaxID=2961597 RepID=UPI0020CA6E55|nr:alpha/beta hydrolase [Halovivax gelatinilyticus]